MGSPVVHMKYDQNTTLHAAFMSVLYSISYLKMPQNYTRSTLFKAFYRLKNIIKTRRLRAQRAENFNFSSKNSHFHLFSIKEKEAQNGLDSMRSFFFGVTPSSHEK